MNRIVDYDNHYWLRIPLTPDNMEEITRYCPNMFNMPADSTDPEHTGIVVGNVNFNLNYTWTGTYRSFGGSLSSGGDHLERIDDNNSRICGHIDNFNEESGTPYIDILCDENGNARTMSDHLLRDLQWPTAPAGTDATYVLGHTRGGISIYDNADGEGYTNLKRTSSYSSLPPV